MSKLGHIFYIVEYIDTIVRRLDTYVLQMIYGRVQIYYTYYIIPLPNYIFLEKIFYSHFSQHDVKECIISFDQSWQMYILIIVK